MTLSKPPDIGGGDAPAPGSNDDASTLLSAPPDVAMLEVQAKKRKFSFNAALAKGKELRPTLTPAPAPPPSTVTSVLLFMVNHPAAMSVAGLVTLVMAGLVGRAAGRAWAAQQEQQFEDEELSVEESTPILDEGEVVDQNDEQDLV